MKILVFDKQTGKLAWTETHYTNTTLAKALKSLKKNNFNPAYFDFKLRSVQ
jgi:hypothetical protein